MGREISENVCSIPLTTPFTAKGSRCDQSWARPHLGLWASYGSDCRVHSWLGVHPEAYVEKFAVGFPGSSEGIYCSQASGLFCEYYLPSCCLSIHSVCWNQLFLFSLMPAEPPLSSCCGGHGSPVRSLAVHPLLQSSYNNCP